MINLLPPELKQAYRYAGYNRRLLQWSLGFLVAIAGAGAITASGLLIMDNSIDSYKAHNATSQTQLTNQHSATTKQQVATISGNLKLMVKVLSKEVLFSKLLTRLGSITPSNVILTNLAITQTQGAVDITAQTTDYAAATQLQVNLADPANQIFSKADIVSLSCPDATSGQTGIDSTYPCTATIQALFTKNNPFLFINNAAKPAGS